MKLNLMNNIFLKIDELRDFMLNNHILNEYKQCHRCRSQMTLKIIESKKFVYRCGKKNCKFRIPLLNSKISFLQYFHCIYLMICDVNYKQLHRFYNLSNSTIFKIKSKLRDAYAVYISRNP
ncbi:hypothetical protein DMUE_2813, partial [Dictyocoela muelleri]